MLSEPTAEEIVAQLDTYAYDSGEEDEEDHSGEGNKLDLAHAQDAARQTELFRFP